jgi:peptidoglycan-associated lipoprotein
MKTTTWFLVVLVAFTAAGCKKKAAVAAPPPVSTPTTAPPPIDRPVLTQAAPRVDSFTAEPARVERGQSINLRWATTNADTVTIDQNVGTVTANGTRQLFPNGTTTYVLIARNATGSDTRTVTVDVIAPPPPPTTTKPSTSESDEQKITRLTGQLQDIYFDYDMSELRDDARRAANTDADILKQIFAINSTYNFVVEGHADERGSAEYNLGLADRRAIITRDALVGLGVPANRLRTVSLGEEMPVCREANESCWQKNRRGHLTRQ